MSLIRSEGFNFVENIPKAKTLYDQMALTAALDSILWSQTLREDVTNPLKDERFPECFQLSQRALTITNKFSGLSQEHRAADLGKLVHDLNQAISRVALGHKIRPKARDFEESCYLYDLAVATFLLIQNAFKVNLSLNVLQFLEPEVFQVYIRALNKFIHIAVSNKNLMVSSAVKQTLLQGMLTVLRVRLFTHIPAVYDNFSDKVLVHHTSALAQTLSEDVDKKKKAIAEAITKEVFQEMDNRWNTRQEINREIKKRLLERYQREALSSMIEIVDLDATFIRAPLSLILEVVQQRVTSYVKYSTERSVEILAKHRESQLPLAKLEKQCFEKKQDLDDVQSPFEVQERYLRIISLYNSTMEIQKFIESKNVTLKQLVAKDSKLKVIAIDSIEYHLRAEEQEKIEKELKRKEYMVKVGLMSHRELEQYKAILKKKQDKEDAFFLNQGKYLKNIASLALFHFQPLSRDQLDMQTHQNLLDMAYRYWELYRQTLTASDEDGCGELEYAMTSLGLYIAADHYIYFMQMLQAQLAARSPARKVLFNLIDSHIFKRHGHMLESSASLIQFVRLQQALGANIEYYYSSVMMETALVHLLTARRDKSSFYLTYEQVRHLSHLFDWVEQSEKADFMSQVDTYFKGGDYGDEDFQQQPVTLKLRSPGYMLDSPEDLLKYEQCLRDILKFVEFQVNTWSSPKLLHAFLTIHTLLINEAAFCSEHRVMVEGILNKLIDEGLLEDESYIMSHGNDYSALVEEFMSSDYASQNEVLYLERRGEQQSIWVKVELIREEGKAAEVNAQVAASLKKADEDEIVLLSKYQGAKDLF